MTRARIGRRTEFVLVPVPDDTGGEGASGLCARHAPAVERLITRYAVEGWVVVAVRGAAPASQVLFRRPLQPSAA